MFLNHNGGPVYTEFQSNGPLRLGKLFLFEGGVRVPMIVQWPGVTKANVVYHVVVVDYRVVPAELRTFHYGLARLIGEPYDGHPRVASLVEAREFECTDRPLELRVDRR